MAPWRPASAASPYRHAVSPARSHVSTESSDPYRLSESATRTSNDAYGDYHEIEKIMRRERQENDRMQAQKAELKEAERRAFVAERRAEAAERAAAERAREADAGGRARRNGEARGSSAKRKEPLSGLRRERALRFVRARRGARRADADDARGANTVREDRLRGIVCAKRYVFLSS